jgi:hypothetical protein
LGRYETPSESLSVAMQLPIRTRFRAVNDLPQGLYTVVWPFMHAALRHLQWPCREPHFTQRPIGARSALGVPSRIRARDRPRH